MPAILPSSRANRCRGPQPVRALADPDASKAEKNVCETNGLYAVFDFVARIACGIG